ncbi:MAG: hypothetical protein D6681_04935 [Calditrichaeota bacterium]|nr:MAG: hypothetical protein D6681_04935 [Calditrichota bacterium]
MLKIGKEFVSGCGCFFLRVGVPGCKPPHNFIFFDDGYWGKKIFVKEIAQNIRYRQFFVAAVAILVLEFAILYSLDEAIRDHHTRLSADAVFLLTEQVEAALFTPTFHLARLTQYTKRPYRKQLQSFCQGNSRIRDLLVIDTSMTIILSTKPGYEGRTYRDSVELAVLEPRRPVVVTRDSLGKIQPFDPYAPVKELDVVWPVFQEGTFKGFIRALVVYKPLYNYLLARRIILWLVGLLIAVGVPVILLLLRKVSQVQLPRPRETEESDTPQNPTPAPSPVASNGNEMMLAQLNPLLEESEELKSTYQEREQKIHSMMRVLNQGLLILDLNMNIITYNEYLLDVLQIRTTANATRKVIDILQMNPRLLEMYRRAKDPLIHELKQTLPLKLFNDRQITAEVLARPFYRGDSITGVAFYLKNTEVLTELETTLQRSMQFSVVSSLASSIWHEVRNPLSSLAIHTEIVEKMVTRSINDEQRLKKIKKSISILNSEVERLQKLINQFFNLAKAREVTLSFENINEVMEEVLELVHQQALENNVTLHRQFSSNLPMVKISKDQIKQVIINLILNAIDAMEDGGEITLSTYFQESNVVISVKDTGCGIPENIRDNIFDLYFTTKESGGGIGLAISRKIVEAHNGKLYFESRLGEGTTFFVELPTSPN